MHSEKKPTWGDNYFSNADQSILKKKHNNKQLNYVTWTHKHIRREGCALFCVEVNNPDSLVKSAQGNHTGFPL